NFALPSTVPSSCPTWDRRSDTLTRLEWIIGSGVAGAHGFQATSCESSLQKCWYMPNKLIIWGRLRGECQKVFPSMDQKNLLAAQPCRPHIFASRNSVRRLVHVTASGRERTSWNRYRFASSRSAKALGA